jgi:L-gulono-1,4-lactone dehydrogenase
VNEWRNWTGDQFCRPTEIERPRDTQDVVEAIGRAQNQGLKVRVAGSGHSFNGSVLTDGFLLSLEHMNHLLDVDQSSGLVRVEAGITLRVLNEVLAANGLALENLGDIDHQSIAGATATGTHGTGGRFQNLSAALHSLELVTADGSVRELNEATDADTWRAARVNLGALGVVTAMTLRAVPAFTLRGVDDTSRLEDVVEQVDELVDSIEFFEFYNFPHSPLAITRSNTRVAGPPRPRSRVRAWLTDVLLNNHTLDLACRVGRRFPARIPVINRTASRLAGRHVRIDRSDRVFATIRRVRFTEMEYALPRAAAAEAVMTVRRVVAEGDFDVPLPMEVRFVAADDAYLSPSEGRDTCYVAVHMFEKMDWRPYFRAIEDVMMGLDGRPHWGKRHFQSAQTLRLLYPNWDRFEAVRARLDPSGMFTNRYIERVLGPPPGAG